MSVTVKSVYGDDIRRFVVSNNSSFEDFASQLRQAYSLDNARFSIRFLDDENELITVTTDAGFREALSLAESGFVKILKFQVHVLPSKPPTIVESKLPASSDSQLMVSFREKTPELKKSHSVNENKPLQASALPFNSTLPPQKTLPSQQQQQQRPPSNIEVFRLLRALVTDNEVSKILPSVLQVLQSSLMHPTTSLQHIIDHILGAFPLIKNHPSVIALTPWFPLYLPKLEPFRQGLCQMASNYSGLSQMFENNSLNWMNFFGGQNPWATGEAAEDDAAQFSGWGNRAPFCGPSDVHLGVTCDACGMRPIQGIRYKCSVCPNFDLCSGCEAQDCHPVDHPMIKTRAPSQQASATNNNNNNSNNSPFMPSGGVPAHPFPGHFASPFGGMHPPFSPWGGLPFGPHGFGGFRGRKCGRKWGAAVPGAMPNGPPTTPGLERSSSRCWRAAQPLQATFVRECNLQDRTEVSASQTLVKTWELQNSGGMAWPAGTKLTYARGDLPSLENSFDVAGPVEPGKTVQVSAVVRTPATPGRYRAFFKLEDNQSNRFGPRLWCDVTVVAPNSVSQVPEPDPVPEEAEPSAESEAAEAKEVQDKNKAAQAFWDKEEVREAADRAEKLRKEAEECVVVHAKPEETPVVPKYQAQLAELHSMGYTNEELNVYLLDQHEGNVESVCAWLLEQV